MMIFKLILSLVGTIIMAVLIANNSVSQSDVNLIFWKFQNVPVSIIAIVSFAVGAIFAIPFAFFEKESKRKEFMDRYKQRLESINKRKDEAEARKKAYEDERAARQAEREAAIEKAAAEKAAKLQAKQDAKNAKIAAKLAKKEAKLNKKNQTVSSFAEVSEQGQPLEENTVPFSEF